MTTLADAIDDIYRQVDAPRWSARNLDALADVLRDLSWLPPGEVDVRVPGELDAIDADRLQEALGAVAAETAGRARAVRIVRT